jgi:hypothetical protein
MHSPTSSLICPLHAVKRPPPTFFSDIRRIEADSIFKRSQVLITLPPQLQKHVCRYVEESAVEIILKFRTGRRTKIIFKFGCLMMDVNFGIIAFH